MSTITPHTEAKSLRQLLDEATAERDAANDNLNLQRQTSEKLAQKLAEVTAERDAALIRAVKAELAAVPLCIGRPIIGHLARDGQWVSQDGRAVIAADELFRKDPYEALDTERTARKALQKVVTLAVANPAWDVAVSCGGDDALEAAAKLDKEAL